MDVLGKIGKWKFGLILIGISTLIGLTFGVIIFFKDTGLEAPSHLLWPILLGLLTLLFYFAFYWVSKGLSFVILILFCLINIGFNLIMMISN